MPTDVWLVREPLIEYQEWLQLVGAHADFAEVTVELAQSEHGNLLDLADSQNHWYWLGHPQGTIVPFSFTQWGIYVRLNDEFTISNAETIARSLGASVVFKEHNPNL